MPIRFYLNLNNITIIENSDPHFYLLQTITELIIDIIPELHSYGALITLQYAKYNLLVAC